MKLLNKLLHPPEYPHNVSSKKGKLAYFYHWHMYLIDTGRGHVFGKVTQLFSETALLLLVIDKAGYKDLTVTLIIILSISGAFLIWFSGWLYTLFNLDKVRIILNRQRDIMFKEIHDKIKNGDKK